ncbi:hypothetical protein DXG01_011976 [Tephrocybe rancida]|nr:hypothetical protein DXG01_011976 [Tephrocybe rancida]
MQVVKANSCGDLSKKLIYDARAEMFELKETMNGMMEPLSAVADELGWVMRKVGEGSLGPRAGGA